MTNHPLLTAIQAVLDSPTSITAQQALRDATDRYFNDDGQLRTESQFVWIPGTTLEQFRATRKVSTDLRIDLPEACEHLESPAPGLIYLDGLFIEDVAGGITPTRWMLTIGNHTEQSSDLASLEERLYAFAVSEGYIDGVAP